MKTEVLKRKIICFAVSVLLALFCCMNVFAADLDGDGYDDETGEYIGVVETVPEAEPTAEITTEAEPEPETEPPTEPITEEPTTAEATQAQTETEPPTETAEETQAVIQEQTQAVQQYVTPDFTLEPEKPTVPKTVSEKTYSTSYMAGFLSWVCVIAGVLIISAVLISTKAGGRKHKSIEDVYAK